VHAVTGYLLHGLTIASELPLGDPAPLDREPDVEVRADEVRVPSRAEVVAAYPFEGDPFYTLHRAPGAWILDVGVLGVVARLDEDLRTVTISPGPDGEAVAGIIAVGAVLGLLLELRGDVALHASAIEVDGHAFAFAGTSGAGKSTLAALTCSAGAGLVADDLLRVELRDGPPLRCHRGAPALRLRRDAIDVADHPRVVEAVETVDERLAVRLPPAAALELALRGIVVPRLDRAAAEVSVEPLEGRHAVAALAAGARFLGWKTREGLVGQFDRATRLAAGVPILRASIPWRRPVPPSLGADVLAALRATPAPATREPS
jgi:hypothetical protein